MRIRPERGYRRRSRQEDGGRRASHGRIAEEEFVAAFTDLFTARIGTAAGTALLRRP
ncbi:hypothetical protein [Kitasatospora sp. MBT63]|uniref:hypothetical protein n=1 Tax=Kitasatospora sp. MBT63 TaxID=1444768 RepID=UPI000AAB3A29|nr:hypothetical protein [Kitasatospora sp. MBT63]